MRRAKLQRAVRHYLPSRGPRDVVLMYHRVREASLDPLLLNVSPAHFAEQMAVLEAGSAPVVPLDALLEPAREPRVAITFDDGYVDNFDVAAPVLRRHGFPASFFVTSRGFVDGSDEFWWDRLEHLFFEGPMGVDHVRLAGADGPVELDVRTEAAREAAYRVCNDAIATTPPAHIEDVVGDLYAQVGRVPPRCAEHARVCRERLAALAADELVHIGAHTCDHPALASLDDAAAYAQLARSRHELGEVLGAPPATMAYPYGGRRAVKPRHAVMAREVGFRLACSTRPDTYRSGSNPYMIPRLHVPDLDGAAFERLLVDFARV